MDGAGSGRPDVALADAARPQAGPRIVPPTCLGLSLLLSPVSVAAASVAPSLRAPPLFLLLMLAGGWRVSDTSAVPEHGVPSCKLTLGRVALVVRVLRAGRAH